jgi:hypothetical protein
MLDKNYINEVEFENLSNQTELISKKISAFIDYLKQSDKKGTKFENKIKNTKNQLSTSNLQPSTINKPLTSNLQPSTINKPLTSNLQPSTINKPLTSNLQPSTYYYPPYCCA